MGSKSLERRQAEQHQAAWQRNFLFSLGGLLLVINAFFLVLVYSDRSGGAMFLALFLGPIANAAVGLTALVGTTLVAAISRLKAPYGTIAIGSVVPPVVAVILDWFVFLIIANMAQHGS